MDALRKLRLPRPRRRALLPRGWQDWALAVLCVVVIAFAISSIGGSSSGAAATERTVAASRGVVQATVSGNGSLEPAQQVELSFGASGEVTAVYVEAGDHVSEGEILARVDASSAEASLASARAQLSEAEETLEAAEEAEEEEDTSTAYEGGGTTTVLAAYLAGDAGGEGTTTSPEGEKGMSEGGSPGAEPESESNAESKPKSESESKPKAESEAESTSPSREEGSAPAAEATEAASEPSSGAEEAGSPLGGGTVSVATAEAQVREARLSVRSAEGEVRETTLRAPFAGTVASVSGEVGETVSGSSSGSGESVGASSGSSSLGAVGGSSSSSSAFIVLSQVERLKMEVSFSESDIGKVKVGQTATVSVSSLEGTELAGRVTKVDVLPGEGSTGAVEYPATILLSQTAKGVRTGMSASAEVVVEQAKNAVSVPSEAIGNGPGGKTVTVKTSGGGETAKTVTTGLVGDETTQIVSGLKAGETVVLPEVTVATGSSGGGQESGGFGAAAGGFPGGAAGFPSGGPPGGGFPGG